MEKANILIAEDDGIVALDIESRLKDFGYAVPAIVSSGNEAINKAEMHNPDLVLMDVVLKGKMDGITTAGLIRDQFNIPVVYLTSYADDNMLERAKITEPYGYIIKPFEDRELRSSIEMALYKHKAEKALRKSEAKYRTLLENIPQKIFYKDTNSVYLACNENYARDLNITPDEIVGKTDYDFYPIKLAEKYRADDKRIVEFVAQEEIEENYLKDGKEVIVQTVKSAVCDEEDNVIGLLGIFWDISERKQTEDALKKARDELERRVEERTFELVAANEQLHQEIREREEIENTLRESEEKYRLLLKNLPSVVYRGYSDWSVEFIDSKIELITGYDVDEFNSGKMKWPDIILKEDIETAKESFIQALKTDKSYVREYRIRTKDGRILWIQEGGQIICDKKGEIKYVSGIFFDISKRKQAEKEIQRSYDIQKVINSLLQMSLKDIPLDEILQRTLDLIHSIPWLAFEGRGCIFLVEDDPEVLVMKAQNGLVGPMLRTCSRVPFGRCLCGRAALKREIQFADCINDQHDISYEGISPHGHYCVPVLIAGKTVGVINVYLQEGHRRSQKEERLLSVVTDTLAGIILRKQVEEQIRQSKTTLQGVFDGISDPLVMLDKDLAVRVLNRAAKAYYQIDFQDVIGKPCYQELQGRSEPCEECITPSMVMEARPVTFERKGLMNPDKLERIFTYPIGGKDSKIGSAIIRISDITEEKKMAQELARSQKMIALGVLAAGVAHEINNPNNFVMLNAPLLGEAWKSAAPILEEYFKKNGDFNMGGLPYSEMRDEVPNLFSGIEEGSRRIKQIVQDLKEFSRQETGEMAQTVDVNTVIKRSIRLVNNLIRKSTLKFKIEYGPNLPSLKGNSQKLEQVMINLIQNACQALSDKEKGIAVSSSYDIKRGGIIVEVRDEGVGIPAEAMPHVMDPFFTTRRSQGGTGLGLSVSANIVKDHGGNIEMKSDRGIGTIFTVFLPTERMEKLTKILVVDDDDHIRRVATTALSNNPSYLIQEASSGSEACIKLGKDRPDLLILDVMMPDTDGVEVCRLIKRDPELSGIKIVIITGYPGTSKVKEIAEMGYKNILLKPFEIKELTQIVDTVLKTS